MTDSLQERIDLKLKRSQARKQSLPDDQQEAMRREFADEVNVETVTSLSVKYKVSKGTVYNILRKGRLVTKGEK